MVMLIQILLSGAIAAFASHSWGTPYLSLGLAYFAVSAAVLSNIGLVGDKEQR